jgi:type VI secretion system protein ImpK
MTAPSLLSTPVPGPGATPRHAAAAAAEARSLLDLMYDGFYMLFLLKNRWLPTDAESFRERLKDFLISVDRGAKRLGTGAEDLYLAKYAYCALVDECVMGGQTALRDAWQRKPLQLELFGDQLAGETFFQRLDSLQAEGAPRVQVLEVFHMCLLLGFQGKYLLEGAEKLGYLTSRLGDDIARMKGRRASFAPHWAAPDRIRHQLRSELPLWVVGSVLALAAMLAFLGLRQLLQHQTEGDLARYSQIVSMPERPAHVTITLP